MQQYESICILSIYNYMVISLIQLIGITKCNRMEANICPQNHTPPHSTPDPGVAVKVKIHFVFRIWSCVAYGIKEFHKCSNMEANILPTDPPPWGWGQ